MREKIFVPKHMQSFAKQNKYVVAEFHRLYKYHNTGCHICMDRVCSDLPLVTMCPCSYSLLEDVTWYPRRLQDQGHVILS